MNCFRFLIVVGVWCASSCGMFSKEDEPKEQSPTAARLVGRIASVNSKEGFVLVQGYGEWLLGEGLLLSSVGPDGRTATMVASGERMGRYAAADIRAGDVKIGDLVYGRPMLAKEETPPGPVPSAAPNPVSGGGGSEVSDG